MEERKIALLIDIENVSPFAIKDIIEDLSQRGTICIRRIYCIAGKLMEDVVKNAVLENNLEIRTDYSIVSGKNSSDFLLVIDAMEMIYKKDIDCFAIVSSDSDFSNLVKKIKSEGKIAIGYGENKTKPQYRSNFNEFVFVENLSQNTTNDKNKLIEESKLSTIDELEKEIYELISKNENDTMQISQIREKLSAVHPDFDERTYNFKKFSDFMKSFKSIEVYAINNGHTYMAKLKKDVKIDEENNDEIYLKELMLKVLKKHNGRVSFAQINTFLKKEDQNFSLKKYGVTRVKSLLEKYKWDEISFDDEKNPNNIILKKQK